MAKAKNDEIIEVPIEELEEAILRLSQGMKILTTSRLKPKTIVMLVAKASRVNVTDTAAILAALPLLEYKYLKPKTKRSRG